MAIVEVSPELELATHMSAQEIRRELALHLYAQGKLSGGKARELAEMDVVAFQCLLGCVEFLPIMESRIFWPILETIKRRVAEQ